MDAVEDIKQRLGIEDVVGEYVQLKRAGRNFKGLSPFTSEKTPSFMVSPEKQIWHDFSSGKGGNMFSFVMEMEGLDFKGALEYLARKAGIDLSMYQTGRQASTAKLKERLYEALELAAKFYQVQFSRNQAAIEYVFNQRGFTKETALAFKLGYSPNNGTALMDFMKKKGFSDNEIARAGLSARRYRGPGDMFRGRLMIPLMDAQGRVIGFTARLLEADDNAPKYINTPQTLLYDKGRHVFGLHLAKDAIRKTGYVVVAEGNLDVVSSYQAGVRQVVATAGTAMTEMHLKALKRFTGDVRLAFDSDRAGQAAAERAIPIAGKVGVTLSMVTIPDGKDPDDLIREDSAAWEKAIEQKQYALDWLIEYYRRQLDLDSATGKRQFSDIVLAVIRQLPDAVEQDHYLGSVARIMGVSKEAMTSKFNYPRESRARLRKPKQVPKIDKAQADRAKTQNQLMALALMRPSMRTYLEPVEEEMFESDDPREVLRFLRAEPDFDGDPARLAALKGSIDYVKMLALQYEALYQDLDELELRYEAARLQVRLIEQFVKTKKQELAEQMRSTDETAMKPLLERANELDRLLRLAKEQHHG
jgi:DNA primase